MSLCETCAAVAHGGRIRLTEESAQLIEALLRSARRISVRARRSAISANRLEQRDQANSTLKMIDWSLGEIARTQAEKGWHDSHGKLQRPDA